METIFFKSAADKATLYQLKNRTAVPADPGDNMKASEDFLLVILHSHIIAAVRVVLSGKTAKDVASLAKNVLFTSVFHHH